MGRRCFVAQESLGLRPLALYVISVAACAKEEVRYDIFFHSAPKPSHIDTRIVIDKQLVTHVSQVPVLEVNSPRTCHRVHEVTAVIHRHMCVPHATELAVRAPHVTMDGGTRCDMAGDQWQERSRVPPLNNVHDWQRVMLLHHPENPLHYSEPPAIVLRSKNGMTLNSRDVGHHRLYLDGRLYQVPVIKSNGNTLRRVNTLSSMETSPFSWGRGDVIKEFTAA